MDPQEEHQCHIIQPSQYLDVVSTDACSNAVVTIDGHSKDRERPRTFFAAFTGIWKVLDHIVGELSNSDVLALALTDYATYLCMLPVLERRKAELWTNLRTPKQDARLMQPLPLVRRNEQVEAAISYLSEFGAICYTGCCSPAITEDVYCQTLLRKYKQRLRLGDAVLCLVQRLNASPQVLITLHVMEGVYNL